jgi:hypothetical protein
MVVPPEKETRRQGDKENNIALASVYSSRLSANNDPIAFVAV